MQVFYVFCATLVFLLISSSKAHTPGTVTVDSFTFDKILRNFDVVLAKFDDKYRMYHLFFQTKTLLRCVVSLVLAYGDKQDAFKKFAENVANTKNLLIAEIPVTDYGEKENEQLAKEYSVTKADFPAYKLFIKGKSKPIDYTGDKTEDDLRRFLSQHTSKRSRSNWKERERERKNVNSF